MKKIILSAFVISLLTACGGSDEKKGGETKEAETAKTDDLSSNPVYQKGLGLVAKSDCLTCHKVDEALTGPTYRDIANKYAGMPDTIVAHLAGKIIKGGNGVWGDTYMTPHASLSQEDAEAMVKYILLLKK
jgi:cytochrome c